jgi:hypothetical protein
MMANYVAERAKSILFYPGYEWKIISNEKRSLREDFFGYALSLILLGTVSQAIGSFFFVRNVLDIDAYRFSFPLMQALSYLLIQIITIIILTFFIHGVAGKFLTDRDFIKSGKVVIYSYTPLYLSYILANLDPMFLVALIPAVYSLYLFAGGLKELLHTNKHKIPAFLFLITIMTLGINYLLAICFTMLSRFFFPDIPLTSGL